MSLSKSVRSLLGVLLLVLSSRGIEAASPALSGLRVSGNPHFLEKTDGTPFFWMGDTAWRLHGITPGDVDFYLSTRVQQKFTGIQTDLGFNTTDYAGNHPYLNGNTDTPNGAFWSTIDSIVSKTANQGLYVALTVMWGGEYNAAFGNDANKAYRLGNWLGNRYGSRSHVLWIVSGEYDSIVNWTNPIDPAKKALFNSLAQGLWDVHHGSQLMTIHPASPITSSVEFHTAGWLSFNMLQSGHQNDNEAWGLPENRTVIAGDYAKTPTKPVLDGEFAYEDTPDGLWIGAGTGGVRMGADVIRRKAWGCVFAGGCGLTYGHNDVHSFWVPGMPSEINQGGTGQRNSWKNSIYASGATQMQHLRALMESRSFMKRIPDQSMIVSGAGSGTNFIQATRASDGSYAFVYIPTGNSVTLDMGKISGGAAAAAWYDPRTGATSSIGTFSNSGTRSFDAPGGSAAGNDWVLVLDATGSPTGGPPAVPSIVSPSNNATLTSTSVTVSWAAANGAASYLVRAEDLSGTTPPDPRNSWSDLFLGIDLWPSTQITFTVVNGHSYHFWVHSASASFSYGDPSSYSAAAELWFSVNTGGSSGGGLTGTYTLLNVNSGLALDVFGASLMDGGAVIQWTPHGGTNQQWKILPVGDGSYYLLNVNSGQALNVAGASMSDGADVIQWPYGGEANSRWLLQPVGAGVRVKAARSNASPAGGAASGKSGGACGLLGLEVLLALGLCRRGSRR